MSVKNINIKKRTYYFFDGIIHITDFDQHNTNRWKVIQKNSYLLYWICEDQKRTRNGEILCTLFSVKWIDTLKKLMEISV